MKTANPAETAIGGSFRQTDVQVPIRRTIGLVGWYWRGNFGDDLMAVLYAVRLKRLGFRVLVWQLSKDVANEYGLEVEDNLEKLVDCADVIVYGGGGLFTNAHRRMEPINGFGHAMNQLCSLIRKKSIPLVLSSVGGDGRDTVLSATQVALIKAASLVTLRNEQDAGWFLKFGKGVLAYPDIVWRTPAELEIRQTAPTDTILIHQSGRLEMLALRLVIGVMRANNQSRRLLSIGCERTLDNTEGIESFTYSNSLKNMLELLQGTRLAVTHRLHLGMTVLALGGTTFAIRPETKARLVYESIGLSNCIIEERKGLLGRLKEVKTILRGSGVPQLPAGARASLAAAADQHINALVHYVQALPKRTT